MNNIKFFTYSQYHNKKNIGSTKIRVDNLLKYWPEASLYKFGDKADVLIFQKVFVTIDYKLPITYPGIRILDICDPEWKDSPDIFIKETLDNVDAVVTSSDNLTEYLQQMTNTPVKTILDRFDISEFPAPKIHKKELKVASWFGYAHNSEALKFAVLSLESRNISLIIISNEDPCIWRYANNPEEYKKRYKFHKYTNDMDARLRLQQGDVMILPPGIRPFDKFKSENRSVVAQLCGLPVVTNSDELDAMETPEARNKAIQKVYNKLKRDYDCRESVREYKELINEINRHKT